MNEQTTVTEPYRLDRDQGITDLWWPYGPSTGRYTIKAGAEQSAGRMIQLLVRDGRGAGTPLHVHTDTDETFYVIEGTLSIYIGGETIEAGPGDYVFAPLGVPHAFVVTSERAEFFVTCAGAGTEDAEGHGIHGFFNEVGVPVRDGEDPPAPREPDPEVFGPRMAAYGIELLGPPPFAG